MTTSPIAPTANGLSPCFRSSRKFVRRPTPAKVNRNAQRDRFASAVVCSLLKKWEVARMEISKKPRTKFGNLRRSEEHTSELQSQSNLVCRLLLEKKKKNKGKAWIRRMN